MRLEQAIKELEKEIHDLAGEPFNIKSPSNLSEKEIALFKELQKLK